MRRHFRFAVTSPGRRVSGRRLPRVLLIGAISLAVFLGAVLVLQRWPERDFSPADQLGPARSYQLSWHGQVVGQQHESLRQLTNGEWLVELRLTVEATVRDAPLRYQETEQLQFAATPPYRLLRGVWQRKQNALIAHVQYENGQQNLTGQRGVADQVHAIEQAALDFSLADYFAASQFVRSGALVGSQRMLKRLDSENLQLLIDEVSVLEAGSRWFAEPWRLSWKRAGERWQAEWLFDAQGMPLAMNVGDAIRLEFLDANAVGVHSVVPAQDLYLGRTIPADRALGQARDVVIMQLRWPQQVKLPLSSSPNQVSLPGFVRTDSRQLGLLAPLIEWQAALAAEPRYSPDDERLQKLSKRLLHASNDDEEKVSRLLNFVSQHLRQQDVLAEQSAADILRSRLGDCTEYSQLFVALARAAGLPAREVSGLVYLGDEAQSFGGHSWAEVVVNGRWLAVDPMWNLLPVSGTHLRMGSGDEGALTAALARRDLQFAVEQISYR